MLNDKIALVTGATRGIGRAIALELGRQGATVIGTATSEGYPVSRESAEYFPDSSTAQQALTDNRWTQREDY